MFIFTWQCTSIIQVICLILSMVVAEIPGITPEWAAWIARVVSCLQAISALIAHWRNPDGTNCRVGYEINDKRP